MNPLRRRRLHALLVLGTAAAAIAIGLSAVATFGPARSTTPDDMLVVGINAEPRSLDPHTTTALSDFRVIVNVYEGLVRFARGSLDIEPALAERWRISEDGLVYTFELKEGVRFHDGTPLNAEAVKFNFDRMLDPEHPYHDTGPFPLAFFFDAVESVEAVDRYTLVLRLSEPYAPLLSNLAYPTGLVVSPTAVRQRGADYGRHPVGTGPFEFVDWEPDRRIELVRSPDYHGTPPPLRGVLFRPVTAEMTRIAELRAGALDVIVGVSPDNIAWFRGHPEFDVLEEVGPHLWYLILNTREPPFDDVRVRRAANHAIRRDALTEHVLQDTAVPAAGAVPRAFDWAYADDLAPYGHDPAKARSLLAEAGYAEGVDVTFHAPQSGSGMLAPVQMAAAIQSDLAAVGIRARVRTFEWNSYLDEVNDGLGDEVDMAQMAWMTNDPDTLPSLALHSSALPPDGFNSGYFADGEVDQLIERARRTTDRDARGALYRELSRRVHELAPWVVVGSWRQNIVLKPDVEGVALQPSFFLLLDRADKRAR